MLYWSKWVIHFTLSIKISPYFFSPDLNFMPLHLHLFIHFRGKVIHLPRSSTWLAVSWILYLITAVDKIKKHDFEVGCMAGTVGAFPQGELYLPCCQQHKKCGWPPLQLIEGAVPGKRICSHSTSWWRHWVCHWLSQFIQLWPMTSSTMASFWQSVLPHHEELVCRIFKIHMNSLSYTQVEELAQRELTQLEFEGINPYKVYELFKQYRPYVPVEY